MNDYTDENPPRCYLSVGTNDGRQQWTVIYQGLPLCAYKATLAEAYGLPRATVYTMAAMLGESEDFDGLIIAIDDAAEENERDELWSLTIEKEPTA